MSNTNLDMNKMLNMSKDELGNFLANLSDEKWALVLKRIPNNIKNAKRGVFRPLFYALAGASPTKLVIFCEKRAVPRSIYFCGKL